MIDYFGDVLLDWNKLEDQLYNLHHELKTLKLHNFYDLEEQLKVQYVMFEVDMRECTNLTSLKGIGKTYLKKIGTVLHLPISINSDILGLMIVKGLKDFGIQYPLMHQSLLDTESYDLMTFTSHPMNAMVGDKYFNSIHNQVFAFDGSQWLIVEDIRQSFIPERLHGALAILRTYFELELDLLDCKEELIAKGFKTYARL